MLCTPGWVTNAPPPGHVSGPRQQCDVPCHSGSLPDDHGSRDTRRARLTAAGWLAGSQLIINVSTEMTSNVSTNAAQMLHVCVVSDAHKIKCTDWPKLCCSL